MSRWQRGDQGPDVLHLTCDRKVAPRQTLQVSIDRWVPDVPNTFGLPARVSCPGATELCKAVCYAGAAEHMKGVAAALAHNLALLQAADHDGQVALLDEAVSRYEAEADRLRLTDRERIFRIHWDGDFYSIGYAEAWAEVIAAHPRTQFWAYTRSFADPVNVVDALVDIENLSLYLSIDEHNATAAAPLLRRYPDLGAAVLGGDFRSARELSADVVGARRLPVPCPENNRRIPLVNEDGDGACVTCQLCPAGRRDILFSATGDEESVAVMLGRWRPEPPVVVDDITDDDEDLPDVDYVPPGPARMNGHDFLAILRRLTDAELDLDLETLVDLYHQPICSDCRQTHTSVWEALVCDERVEARARRTAARAARTAARNDRRDAEDERREHLRRLAS